MITTTLELALAALVVEFALLALVFAGLLWRGNRRQQVAAVETVGSLVSNVAQSEAPRRQALLNLLRDSYEFDGPAAERVVSDFIEREQAFYNMLIGVHLGRGGKTLADVPSEVTRLVAPWLKLTPGAAVADLESRNQALSAELDETKKVLDDLVREYSVAFVRAGAPAPDLGLEMDEEPDAPAATPTTPDFAAEVPEEENPALGAVRADQLLSMDEFDAEPVAGRGADTTPAANRPDDYADLASGFGAVIDLADDSPGPAALPMSTEDDLDLLMQNLGLEAAPPDARTQAAA
jgi:hypothetical protein